MLFSLETKDVVGPLVSIGAAALSAFRRTHANTQKLGPCDLYRGAEISLGNLQATDASPSLWCIYNDEELQKDSSVNESFPTVPCEDKGFRAPTEASRRERSYDFSRGTREPSSPIWKPARQTSARPYSWARGTLSTAIELSVTLNAFLGESRNPGPSRTMMPSRTAFLWSNRAVISSTARIQSSDSRRHTRFGKRRMMKSLAPDSSHQTMTREAHGCG